MRKKWFKVCIAILFVCVLSTINGYAISQTDINNNLQKMKNQYPNGGTWCGTYYANDGSVGPWDCFGFACEVFRGVFGCEMPRAYTSDMWHFANTNNVICIGSIGSPKESQVKNLLSTAKPGDIIQAMGNVQHTMVVTHASSSGINVFDANSDSKNTIRYAAYLSHATIANTYYVGLSLYRYKNYPTDDTNPTPVAPAAPTIRLSAETTKESSPITVSWDAVSGATEYEYYLTEFPEGWAYETNTHHGTVTGTSITFSDLRSGRYTIFIHAVSADGLQSPQSNWTSFNVYADDYVPVKTISSNNHIYALYDYEMSWTFARDLCTDLGGHLVTVTSEDENSTVSNLIQHGSKDSYWLGATSYGRAEKDFVWVTNETFTYNNWASGEPNGEGTNAQKELYAEIKKSYGYKWNDVKNTAKSNKGFILEIDTENIQPIATETFNENTYMLFDKNITWTEAKIYCELLGGHLMTLNNDAENEFLKDFLQNGNRAWYYIGAEKINGNWKWIDGNNFSNITWHENASSWVGTHLIMYKGSKKCIGLDNAYYPESDIRNIGFVCEIEQEPDLPIHSKLSTNVTTENLSILNSVAVSLENSSVRCINCNVIFAYKYANGEIAHIDTKDVEVAGKESLNIESKVSNRIIDLENKFIDSVEVFVWNSIDNMKPLAEKTIGVFTYE